MKTIKLIKAQIDNFKGIKSLRVFTDGKNTTITGENGTCKTSVYDAFLWALFGKDSGGRKDFNVRPLDSYNKPINNIEVCVDVALDVNGEAIYLKKKQLEKIVKGEFKGYETKCWVNDAPHKIGEFQTFINQNILTEESFKMLTDTAYINAKLHWKDRRDMLLGLAGDMPAVEGFEELLGLIGKTPIDKFKAGLLESKRELKKERDEIPNRIDEQQRNADGYVVDNFVEVHILEEKRDTLEAEIGKLGNDRNEVLDKQRLRQVSIEKANTLKGARSSREYTLNNSTTAIQGVIDEKAQLLQKVAGCEQNVTTAENALRNKENLLTERKQLRDDFLSKVDSLRKEYTELEAKPLDNICPCCERELPENKLDAVKIKRNDMLLEIKDSVANINQDVKRSECTKVNIEQLEADICVLKETVENCKITLEEAEAYKAENLPRIEDAIKNKPVPDYTKDEQWQSLTKQITEAEAEAGKPVPDCLKEIDDLRAAKLKTLQDINATLSNSDSIEKAQKRIAELKEQETVVAQKIADNERILAMLADYKTAESSQIESCVNDLFEHVEFRLFKKLVNGENEQCCDAMLNGVPYADISTGQKILAGVDVINALSTNLGLNVVLFIDNAESLTLPVDTGGQIIRLVADKNVKEITVSQSGVNLKKAM